MVLFVFLIYLLLLMLLLLIIIIFVIFSYFHSNHMYGYHAIFYMYYLLNLLLLCLLSNWIDMRISSLHGLIKIVRFNLIRRPRSLLHDRNQLIKSLFLEDWTMPLILSSHVQIVLSNIGKLIHHKFGKFYQHSL